MNRDEDPLSFFNLKSGRMAKQKTNKNIEGRKIHEYGKPKAPTNFFFQLHLSLIYLHCTTN
jgi:hypothetical protein